MITGFLIMLLIKLPKTFTYSFEIFPFSRGAIQERTEGSATQIMLQTRLNKSVE